MPRRASDPKPPAAPDSLPETALPETALVPLRARADGWTPQRQRVFIEILADSGSVCAAAQAVGMSRESAYRLRRHHDARAFDAAWEAALERAMQRLLPAAIDRALNGTVRQRWYHGELIAEERVYSDGLMRFLLERGGAMLGAARARQALREDWETHMDALEAGHSAPPEPAAPPPAAPLDAAPLDADWDEADADDDGQDLPWQVDRHPHDDAWITNAPEPPGFDPDEALSGPGLDGWRYCDAEESAALDRIEEEDDARDEAARRRFFHLPPLPPAAPAPAPGNPPANPPEAPPVPASAPASALPPDTPGAPAAESV